MSTTTAGVLFLLVLLAALAMVHVPFGDYMFRVYTSGRDSHVERVIYRLIGVDSCAEQTRGACARSVLAFSSVSILFLFGFQLVQGTLPLHLHDPATRMAPTASGSGLDPNISPAYADLQVARVARARWPGPGTSARSRSLSRWRRAEPGVAWGFSASHASTCCSSTCNSTAGIRSRARNRLGWTSSWPGCGPRSAAPPRRRRPTNR